MNKSMVAFSHQRPSIRIPEENILSSTTTKFSSRNQKSEVDGAVDARERLATIARG